MVTKEMGTKKHTHFPEPGEGILTCLRPVADQELNRKKKKKKQLTSI